MKRIYSEEFKANALVQLELNAGNVKDTARKLKMDRTTLMLWRDKSQAVLNTIPPDLKQARIDLWDKVQQKAAQRLTLLLETADNVRDVAYAGDRAVAAYLDLRDGRKGAEVNIDNSTRSVTFIQGAIQAAIQARDVPLLGVSQGELKEGEAS